MILDISPSSGPVPSILKWTGSKRSQAAAIARLAPPHQRYFEPFLGGGALLYLLGRAGSVGSDLFAPLIAFWRLVRDDPHILKEDYRAQWTALQADLPGYFYVVRDRFNARQDPRDLNFLMRTCVNGIVRFSKDGRFNNSFHLSRRGMLPETFDPIVDLWSHRLVGIELIDGDYRTVLDAAKAGDFVYLDPPYAGNRQRYISDLDPAALIAQLDLLNRRGVKWALSFDGARGDRAYDFALPSGLYQRKQHLVSGLSAVSKVLNGPIESVSEALYLNY